jgi:periplasmic copper chaperone A
MSGRVWLGIGCLMLVACGSRNITVSDSWVRATAPGQQVAAAFMTLRAGKTAALVGAQSPACEAIQLHSMSTQGGVMRMREVSEVGLPAGVAVKLESGSYHMMLTGLKQALEPGSSVAIELKLRYADGAMASLQVNAEVRR